MKGNAATPTKIALLSIGILAAVAFAIWNIGRALSPPTPAEQPVEAAAPAPAAPAAPGAAAPPATQQPVAAAPAVSQPAQRGMSRSEEERLAPRANPFTPLPPAALRDENPPAAPAYGSVDAPAPRPFPSPAAAAAQFAASQANAAAPLPLVHGQFSAALPSVPGAPVGVAAVDVAPKLVGTLVGDRPSAVFDTGKGLAVVPVGSAYGMWRVASVSHGGAVVRSRFRVLRLSIAGDASSGRISLADAEDARATARVETDMDRAEAERIRLAVASVGRSEAVPTEATRIDGRTEVQQGAGSREISSDLHARGIDKPAAVPGWGSVAVAPSDDRARETESAVVRAVPAADTRRESGGEPAPALPRVPSWNQMAALPSPSAAVEPSRRDAGSQRERQRKRARHRMRRSVGVAQLRAHDAREDRIDLRVTGSAYRRQS